MSALTAEKLEKIFLKGGSHSNRRDGVCVMEAVAWMAGEKHSDHPVCVSPSIGAFLRKWNDDLQDEDRQMLKPYIAKVIGTVGTAQEEDRRAWMLTDWLIRQHTPAWLELAGLKDQAAALRTLPEAVSIATLKAAQPSLDDARTKAAAARAAAWAAAWAAAGAAAWDAAWAAAWAAAGAAARAAAWDAAWAAAGAAAWAAAWDAAGDAARAAAGDAARAAAWDAARAAAWAAVKPPTVSLQRSALELLDRLIAVTEKAS